MLVMKAIVVFSPDPRPHPYHTYRNVLFDHCDMIHGPNKQAQPAHFHSCAFENCRFTMTQGELEASGAFISGYYESCHFGVSHETMLKEAKEAKDVSRRD